MSTGQTLITIGAFVLLMTMLVSFYRILAQGGQTVDASQTAITEVSLATSYTQLAQALHFDEATRDTFLLSTSLLSSTLGPEVGDDSIDAFDDFDDFNGLNHIATSLASNSGTYKTKFVVNYVVPSNISQISASKTFVKRMDMTITRINPPSTDTLRVSVVMGYWHFTNTL